MLFGVLPFVTFFNVAHVEFDATSWAAWSLGWLALAAVAALAWLLTRGRVSRPASPAR